MRSVSEDRVEAADTEAARSEDAEAASKERLLRRKHSRASSVDRREIFQKYVSTGSEHAATVALYTGPDTANNTNNILNSITAAADTAANTGNTANRSVIIFSLLQIFLLQRLYIFQHQAAARGEAARRVHALHRRGAGARVAARAQVSRLPGHHDHAGGPRQKVGGIALLKAFILYY